MGDRIKLFGVVLLGVAMLGATGCAPMRLKSERDALLMQNEELQDELDATRTALDRAEARNRELRDRAELQVDARDTQPGRDTGFEDIAGVETFEGAGFVTVRVPGDVLFAPGQASLRDAARQTLSEVARVLQSDYPDGMIRIEGYTDTDPIRVSGWEDNLELSAQRAMSVHRYLQERGIDPARMYVGGFGEWHPRGTKEQSRRVEFVVEREP